LVWVQYEAAALRLSQAKAHAGNAEVGVVGRIERTCATIWLIFEKRSRREIDAVVII
jgi:hypothetical protein